MKKNIRQESRLSPPVWVEVELFFLSLSAAAHLVFMVLYEGCDPGSRGLMASFSAR